MLKKILIGVGILVLLALLFVFGVLYKSDLSKDQLPRYITDESEFVQLPNGANMHYRDEGNSNGPALVMIHGGFGSLQNWDGWVSELKDDYRLISMDLMGHGLTGAYPENIYTRISSRDAVHMLLQKLDVDQYTVAGNSWGGGIALEMALEYPSEVEGLILVDAEGVPNGEEGYDLKGLSNENATSPNDPAFTALSGMERFMSKLIGPTVIKSTLGSMLYDKDLMTDEFVDYYGRVLRHKGNRESQILMFRQGLWQVAQNGPQDLRPRLPEVNAPTLVIQGSHDTLVPMRVSEIFAREIPTAELAVIDKAGHMPMIEQPKTSAHAVTEFFEKYILK